MDNTYQSVPLLTEGRKTTIPVETNTRNNQDEMIRGLENKNYKLKQQIMKIQEVINTNLQEIPQQPKKRESIMRSKGSEQSTNQELSNCYKKIQMYEYQIHKIQQSQATSDFVQKGQQISTIVVEKKAMGDRLKLKLLGLERTVADNIKKLQNGHYQGQIDRKLKSLTDQIKFLQEKHKQILTKDQMKQNNMKNQYEYIKKLQNQLLDNQFSHGELEQIKFKVIKQSQHSSSLAESHVNSVRDNKSIKKQMVLPDLSINRTSEGYRQILKEIQLLQKMQIDYEKQELEAERDKIKAIQANKQSKDRLLEVQKEIQSIQKEILLKKGKVLPSNMKPLRALRSYSSQIVVENKNKKVHIRNNVDRKPKTLNHILRFDEVGMASEKGLRFTDRNILGNNKVNTKLIGLTVFVNLQTKMISGIQATYSNSKKGGEYVRKERDIKTQQYSEEEIICESGEFIKNIAGTLDSQDKLQSLHVVTNKGNSKRFGKVHTLNKSFSFDIANNEVPVCIFGSLLIMQEKGKPEHSLVEHFGIEINLESAKGADFSFQTLQV